MSGAIAIGTPPSEYSHGTPEVPGPVRGAVVHDDRLEAAVARDLVQDAPDLPRLVEGGDDDGDERNPGFTQMHVGYGMAWQILGLVRDGDPARRYRT